MAEPQPLFDYTGYLPECPTWSEAEQALYWADIMECEIHRYDIRSGEHRAAVSRGGRLFALREKGGFIVALRSGIWRPTPTACCGGKSAITRATRSWRGLTTADRSRWALYAGTFWGTGITTARC